jgi:hypothetical protein
MFTSIKCLKDPLPRSTSTSFCSTVIVPDFPFAGVERSRHSPDSDLPDEKSRGINLLKAVKSFVCFATADRLEKQVDLIRRTRAELI